MPTLRPRSAAFVPRSAAIGVIALTGGLLIAPAIVRGQIDSEPPSGIRDVTPRLHALTGARVFVTPTTVLESATIVLRDGRVASVGEDVDVPAGARIWDLAGRIVYPGFIDPMSEIGLPASLKRPPPHRNAERPAPPPPAPPEFAAGFWNPMIKPEVDVAAMLELDDDAVAALRELGITAALAVPRRGVLRGQSAVVLSRDPEGLPCRRQFSTISAACRRFVALARIWTSVAEFKSMSSLSRNALVVRLLDTVDNELSPCGTR